MPSYLDKPNIRNELNAEISHLKAQIKFRSKIKTSNFLLFDVKIFDRSTTLQITQNSNQEIFLI